MPNGTAIVVVQNFYCPNMWHALANLHGVWLMLKVMQIHPSEVVVVLPDEYGTPFKFPPKYPADLLWPLYVHSNNITRMHSQKNCFQRVAFIETAGYRPGPYWALHKLREKCPQHTPYMRTHFSFYNEANSAALRALGLEKVPPTNDTRPVVCYMSRRLREGRRRYFSEQLEPIVESALDKWALSMKDTVLFDKLEFTEQVPFEEQWARGRQCSILFGPHGAGLGHMIWMPAGGHVIEFGSEFHDSECNTYFGAQASWYRHHYTCFSELTGHNISLKNNMYQSMNVTLCLGS